MSIEEIIEAINVAVLNYIKNAGITSKDDLDLTKKLNDIILYQDEKQYGYNFTTKFKLNKSYKYSYDFLKSINQEYADYLLEKTDDGTIYFDENDSFGGAYCDYDEKTDKVIIYIPVSKTIEDAFKIVHELFHGMNTDKELSNPTRMFLTEGISFLGELLLEDYLVENKVKNAKVNNNLNLYYLKSKAIEVDFNIQLIYRFLDNDFINEFDINDILNSYPDNYKKDLAKIVHKICLESELTLDEEQSYIIGSLITFYMYDRIKQNKNNIKELFELNEMIIKCEFENVLDYLDLDHTDDDLTYQSYEKLRDSYQKVLKSR